MSMIKSDNRTHSIVFTVNIDSPKNHQVKTGNMRYDIAKTKKRTLQIEPNASYPNLVPKYANNVVGMARTTATTIGFVTPAYSVNWRFVLNHASTWSTTKHKKEYKRLIFIARTLYQIHQ